MKNIIKTISYIALAAVAVVGIAVATQGTAFAAASWANGSLGQNGDAGNPGSECPIAMVGNATTNEGISNTSSNTISNSGELCWSSSISTVEGGETLNILAKFKNTGDQTINSGRVKVTTGSSSATVTLSGSNVSNASDSVSFNIESGETISFVDFDYYKVAGGSVIANQQDLTSSSLFGSGYSIGGVNPGDYGYLVISYQVSNNGNNNGGGNNPTYNPDVTLEADDYVIDEGDDVTLIWDSNDVTSCSYNSSPNTSWEDNFQQNTDGSWTVFNLQQDTDFYITCESPDGQQVDADVTVYVTEDGNGGGNNDDDEPDADTWSPRDIEKYSADLRGEIDMNDFNNGVVFFVYGQDEDMVEDVEDDFDSYSDVDEDGDDLMKVRVDNDLDGTDDYSENVDDLEKDEKYYYQICVEFEDEDNDDKIICGGIEDFRTDDNNTTTVDPVDDPNDGGVDQVSTPLIITLPESDVTTTSAVINGGYNAKGCDSLKTQFLIGTNPNALSVDTSLKTRGNTFGLSKESVSGLNPGTIYYYQAVGFCKGTPIYGDIQSFTTRGRIIETPVRPVTPVVPSTPVTPTIITQTLDAGTGLGCIALDITNNQEVVTRGENLTYFVTWENLCEQDFENAVLDVKLPKDVSFTSTTRGQYTGKNEHSVITALGDIDSQEDGEMIINVQVRPAANTGEVIVVEANIGGDGVSNNIDSDTTAFDFDEVADARVGLAAAAFGSGFLFQSVWGWLLLLLILAGIILATRYFYALGKRAEPNPYGYYAPAPQAYAQVPAGYAVPQQPMYVAPAQPVAQPMMQQPVMQAPATMAPAPQNLPAQNPENLGPDYTVYRPAPFDGQN